MPQDGVSFKVHHDSFKDLLGPDPKVTLLLEKTNYPLAHEAGVYVPSTGDLYFTSNQFSDGAGGKQIKISRYSESDGSCEEINTDVPNANGGVNYKDGVLFCAQGSHTKPGGMVYMEAHPPYRAVNLIEGFHRRPFNSVNDVVVHQDGSIWFTDPIYGYEQGIRPEPQLPSMVYRYDPKIGSIRAVADGFDRPNGICFSPDAKTVYITDTGSVHGDGTISQQRPSTM